MTLHADGQYHTVSFVFAWLTPCVLVAVSMISTGIIASKTTTDTQRFHAEFPLALCVLWFERVCLYACVRGKKILAVTKYEKKNTLI